MKENNNHIKNEQMNTQTTKKTALFFFGQIMVFLVIAVLSGYIGYTIAKNPFKKLVQHYDKFRSVGSLYREKDISQGLTHRQRDEYYKVYQDQKAILSRADDIIWMVPNTLTPFVGVAPTPGTHGNTHINSMQFRSDSELTIPKPYKEIRIFITGGSTAFGSGAPDQNKIIGALLENKLNANKETASFYQFKVYTFANPAWASTQERIAIENRLSELEPDLVISLSGNNDVYWGGLGRDILWFRTFIDDFCRLVIQDARKLAGREEDLDIVTINPKPINVYTVAQRLTKNVMISAYALSLKNIPYLFCLQPTLAVTKKALTPREKDFLVNQKYFNLCYQEIIRQLGEFHSVNRRQNGQFYFSDLSQSFDDMKDPTNDIFLDSFHFGDKGNIIVADKMFNVVKQTFGQMWKLKTGK